MNQHRLTAEQRALLKPYERHLHTAVYASYVVGLDRKTATVLFDTYNAIFDAHERNLSCNFCVMQVCTRLGRLYYAEEEVKAEETPAPAPKKVKKGKK